MLELHLLGPLRLSFEGSELAFRALPKVRPLLAYLVLRGPAPVEREEVALALWPDRTVADAKANLRRHVQHLRAALPPGRWVGTSATHLWWVFDECRVDVHAFEDALQDEARHEEAVALYTGELLQGVDEDWLSFDRDRLRARYLVALGGLVARYRSALDHTRAILCAERLLAEDPLREDIVRQLMALHADAGNRASALAVFKRFRDLLADELGVPPMPETRLVHDRIARGDAAAPHAPSGRSAPAASWRLPFVGRGDELAVFKAACREAFGGASPVVAVSGEAGVGKSRLVREAALIAESEGLLVLSGRTPPGEDRAHHAVAEALGAAVPLLLDLPEARPALPALAALLPALRARRPDLPALEPLPGERETHRLAQAVAQALGALGRARPVLFVLEDLHASDVTSRRLVSSLRHHAPARAVSVLTARSGGEDALVARQLRREWRDDPHVRALSLGRLDETDAQRALAGLVDDAAIAALAARSDGLPLHLAELAFEARGQGGGKPGSIAHMVRARLARLAPDHRSLLDLAAVAGPDVDLDLLEDLSGWTERDLLGGVDALVHARFLREAAAGRLSFAHGLVHDLVYGAVPPAARRRLHARAARLLAETPGRAPWGRVMRHFEQAGHGEEAAAAAVAAARDLTGLGAYAEAAQTANRALALTADASRRFELGLARIKADALAGGAADLDAEIHALGGAVDALPRERDDLAGEYFAEAFSRASRTGDTDGQRRLLDRWEARVPAGTAAAGRYLRTRGWFAEQRGDAAPALARWREAADVSRAAGDDAGAVWALCRSANLLLRLGRAEEHARVLAEAEAVHASTAAPSAPQQHEVLFARGVAANARSDREAALEVALALRDLARTQFDPNLEAVSEANTASALIALRRFEEAQAPLERARALFARVERRDGLVHVDALQAAVLAGQGRFAAALAALDARRAHLDPEREARDLAENLVGTAHALATLGRPDEAFAAARRAVDLVPEEGAFKLRAAALFALGQTARLTRTFEVAERELLAALSAMDRALAYANANGERALTWTELALVSLARGRPDEATWRLHQRDGAAAETAAPIVRAALALGDALLARLAGRSAPEVLEAAERFLQEHASALAPDADAPDPRHSPTVEGLYAALTASPAWTGRVPRSVHP